MGLVLLISIYDESNRLLGCGHREFMVVSTGCICPRVGRQGVWLVAWGLLLMLIASPSVAQRPSAAPQSWEPLIQNRIEEPEVVTRALRLIKQGQAAEAADRLDEALKRSDWTVDQLTQIQMVLLKACMQMQQFDRAETLANQLLENPKLNEPDRYFLLKNQLSLALQTQRLDWAQSLVQALLKIDPEDTSLWPIQTRLYFLNQQFANALHAAQLEYAALKSARKPVAETTLRIWTDSARQVQNASSAQRGMSLLLAQYPSSHNWSEALYDTLEEGGFRTSGDVHFYRLLRATGALSQPEEFLNAAEVFYRSGYLAEAESLLLEAQQRPEFESQELSAQVQDQLKQVRWLKEGVPSVASSDVNRLEVSDQLLNSGLNQVAAGRIKEGTRLLNRAVGLGQFKSPPLAMLTYAEGLQQAGLEREALTEFAQLTSDAQLGRVAKLWTLHLRTRLGCAEPAEPVQVADCP